MKRIIIDAKDTIFGRLCSFIAKKAIEGNEVIVINSEKVLFSGKKENVIKDYKKRRSLGGTAQKGPFISKLDYMILKRGIRGMLPDYRRGFGREAFKRIKCYNGVPKEFENEKPIELPEYIKKKTGKKYVRLEEVTNQL